MAERNIELGDFLRRARSRVDPSRAGLPVDGRVRRVPGLRREEVALLAGMSTDYYTRMEQGRATNPSAAVVAGVGRALGLDDTEQAYLRHLCGGRPARPSRVAPVQRVRPGLHRLADALASQPVLVLGRRAQVLASNRLARALFADFDRMPARERNYAVWMLLTPEARQLFVDWDLHARAAVETLRLDHARHPDDRDTNDLITMLQERSGSFRTWWSAHGVYQRTHGTKRLHHPVVGELEVGYETFALPDDPDQTVFVYSADPGSASSDALELLAGWATPAPVTNRHPAPRTP